MQNISDFIIYVGMPVNSAYQIITRYGGKNINRFLDNYGIRPVGHPITTRYRLADGTCIVTTARAGKPDKE